MTTLAETEREFVFEPRHFRFFQSLARTEAGIEVGDNKHEMVYGRIARRLRDLGLASFDEYLELVAADGSPERLEFVNSITTNVTSFFREGHHFEFLRNEGLPTLMANRRSSRKLRIWSAACSTGQEPYSIAITAADVAGPANGWDCKILATDIDSSVVARAEVGVYDRREVASRVDRQHRRWFDPVDGSKDQVRVGPLLRTMIHFRLLNLLQPWPMSGPLDVIFCRNVVIYFSPETQHHLLRRFAELLAPDGFLFLGHSESAMHSPDLFEPLGRTIYRPKGGGR